LAFYAALMRILSPAQKHNLIFPARFWFTWISPLRINYNKEVSMGQSSSTTFMVISKVIAQAMIDSEFRRDLKARPVQVLSEQGLTLPPGREIKVVEDSDKVVHLTIPDHLDGQKQSLMMDDPVGRLILKAAADQNFRQQLLQQPRQTLMAQGWQVKPDLEYKVLQDTGHLNHLVIPQPPAESELSDEELDSVAGGFAGCCGSCAQCKAACVCVIGSCHFPDACSNG
jgi:hypothetical protein